MAQTISSMPVLYLSPSTARESMPALFSPDKDTLTPLGLSAPTVNPAYVTATARRPLSLCRQLARPRLPKGAVRSRLCHRRQTGKLLP